LRQEHSLSELLQAAEMASSTFYYQLKAQQRPDASAALKERIRDLYNEHEGRLGYRRITLELRANDMQISYKRVQRLMQLMDLKSIVRPKRFVTYKGQVGTIAPDLLQRQFKADAPNQKWVTDITQFQVDGRKLYFSPVMDLHNGEIVSHQISTRPVLKLVTDMLKKALRKLAPGQKPLLHSDQGWHYQQPIYCQMLAKQGVAQSMSRKGNCLDNASMESFFAILKTELFHVKKFDSIEALESAIHRYIDYYNHKRGKLRLGGLSPVQYRLKNAAP